MKIKLIKSSGFKSRMRNFHTVLVLAVFVGGSKTSSADDCSVPSLSACLKYFISAKFDMEHLDDDVPAWNDTSSKLQKRCQAFNRFSVCIEPVIPSCNSSFQVSLKGLVSAYQFLCSGDGYREYQLHQNCFRAQQTVNSVKLCNKTFNSKLSGFSKDGIPASQYCRYLDDYIECLTAVINDNCGQNASKWENNWIQNLKKFDMALKKCPDWAHEEPTEGRDAWATALVVALAMTTALMAIGILSLVVCIIKRRLAYCRGRIENPDLNQTPLPPPYSVVLETPGPDGQLQTHLVDSQSASAAAATEHGQFASSLPHKEPILPPPYCERLAPVPAYCEHLASAPAYEDICSAEAQYFGEQVNEGYRKDEGEDNEKLPNNDNSA